MVAGGGWPVVARMPGGLWLRVTGGLWLGVAAGLWLRVVVGLWIASGGLACGCEWRVTCG